MATSLPASITATVLNPHIYYPISVAANFFHAYPRLFNASKTFSTAATYRVGLYKLGVPYFSTGLTLFLIALIANFYFFFRRGVVPGADDTHESDPHRRDKVGRMFLLFSCFLNLGVILCIAIAFASAFTMRAAAKSAHDVLDAAHVNVSLHISAPAKMVLDLGKQAGIVNMDAIDLNATEAVEGVQDLFKKAEDALGRLVDWSAELFGRLDTVNNEVAYLSNRFFWFTFFVLVVCAGGLMLTFFCDVTTPDARSVRIIAFAFLLLPLVASWAHLAVATWIAVASGDFCQSVDEYYRVVLEQARGESAIISTSNIFGKYNLQCPKRYTDTILNLKQMNIFFGDTAGFEGFDEGFALVTNNEISKDSWTITRDWAQDRIEDYENCDTQVALAGRLSYYVCGDHGLSAVAAVGQLWLCSFGLALLFTVIIGLLTWGHPPSEFITGREFMYVYGAPKLISTFGDVESILRQKSAFRRLESGLKSSKKISPTSSDSDIMKEVAEDYNLDSSDTSSSTDRPRRDAYESHKMRNEKPELSQYSLYRSREDNQSTDSSEF